MRTILKLKSLVLLTISHFNPSYCYRPSTIDFAAMNPPTLQSFYRKEETSSTALGFPDSNHDEKLPAGNQMSMGNESSV